MMEKLQFNRFYLESEIQDLVEDDKLGHHEKGYYLKNPFYVEPTRVQDFIVRDYNEQDFKDLKKVYYSCSYMKELTGQEHNDEHLFQLIRSEEVPPGGDQVFVCFKVIEDSNKEKVIGFIEYYLGFPNPETLWVGLWMVDRSEQGRGIGKTIFQDFKARSKGVFKQFGIGVYESNKPALAFWQKNGFCIDPTYTPKTDDAGFTILKLICEIEGDYNE